ncbi:MAG: extracellular solute-binding protein [Treponema sp.]|nr:extracellular solute-binding protein [Treponema sp.]
MDLKTYIAAISTVLIVLFVSCGNRREQIPLSVLMEQTAVTAAPGQFPLTKEKSELTVLLAKPAHISDLNNNLAAEWYEELTNVRVRYIHTPYHTARESANLHIATGDYPDIIMFSWMTTMDEINYGSQGIFVPLNELIEQHSYWFHKVTEQIPDVIPAITLPDGKIYGLPNINQTLYTFYQHKAWVNRDWLDRLGLAMPETTEEFYEMLKVFQTMDPNGNGRDDEIPMMGYFGVNTQSWPYPFLLNSFVYFDPQTFLALEDGQVVFTADTEEFREGLRFIARLVDEGLLHRASFTQNVDQARQLGMTPDAARIGVFTDLLWGGVVGDRLDMPDFRADNYIAIPPLRGPRGVRYAQITSVGINPAFANITDNARDPVLAFRWLEGMYSEEATKNLRLGIKGVIHDDPDEGALGINRQPALFKTLVYEGEPPHVSPYFAPMLLGNQHVNFRIGRQTDWNDPEIIFETEVKAYLETVEKYHPFRPPSGVYYPLIVHHTAGETVDAGRMSSEIRTYVHENIAAFLTGNRSLDRDWDAYIAGFRQLELSRYLELKQTAYNRQYRQR